VGVPFSQLKGLNLNNQSFPIRAGIGYNKGVFLVFMQQKGSPFFKAM
jgi:hypothetical protein